MAMTTSPLSPQAIRFRVALLAVLAGVALIIAAVVPRHGQDQAYHELADHRPLWGIPHSLNVLSNLPFVIFGLAGIAWLLGQRQTANANVIPAWEKADYYVLFVFITMTGIGSSYYHLEPTDARIFWDRLPLTVVLMTFFALVVAERVHPRSGPWLWPLFVAAGVFALLHWYWTETQGNGDIRLYALVQIVPIGLIPVLLLLFPARYYRTADVFAILAWYVLAKVLELTDGPIYSASGFVSGHTLKHLAASMGALWLLFLLRGRYAAAKQALPREVGA